MQYSSVSKYLAAFGLGYSTTILQNNIIGDCVKNKRESLIEYSEQVKTYEDCFRILFGKKLNIPSDYISDPQLIDFFSSLFESSEEGINACNDVKILVYFFAGGFIYLADTTHVDLDQKKLKTILYEMLTETGSTVSWNEVSYISSQLFCSDVIAKREAKKKILDYMFKPDHQEFVRHTSETHEKIIQNLLT